MINRGYLKSKVYKPKPATLEELKARIKQEIRQIDPDMIKRACGDGLRSRCQRVLIKAGDYVE